MEINGVKLTKEELAGMIDSYLASRHYIMWAKWDINQNGSRESAGAWFLDQLEELTTFLPEKAVEQPAAKRETPWMERPQRTLVAVGD